MIELFYRISGFLVKDYSAKGFRMTHFPLLRSQLIVKKSPIHGYGVYADQNIQLGEIIEECYTLPIKDREAALMDYIFVPDNKGQYMLPLGYGAIYNHSEQPNAVCIIDCERSLITFQAERFIERGEEIFISYGENWFGSRHIKHKEASLRFRLRRFLSRMLMLGRFGMVVGVLFTLMMAMKK